MSAYGSSAFEIKPVAKRPSLQSRSRSSGSVTMNANYLPPPSLHVQTAATQEDTPRMYSPVASTASSPTARTPRRPSQSVASSLHRNESPNPRQIRRSSSAMSLNGARSTASPTLGKKSSRTSLNGHGDQVDSHLTPKRSISNLIAGLREAQSSMDIIEESTPLTAAQIASDHFRRELASHENAGSETKAIVVLHDACYGHRWSRLKTGKTALSMIVERPERILAGALGTSLAYVRLGGHHAGERHAPHPHITTASMSPPFQIRRSVRALGIMDSCVTNVHGTSWMSELHQMCGQAVDRLSAGMSELARSNRPNEPDKPGLHEGDLYLSPESLAAFQGALGAVADAVDTVFDSSNQIARAFVAIRPPGHHCSSDHPSGFCWLNNVHVGIEYAAQKHGLTHAAILDFDLHHGDGSQAITWERNSRNNTARLNAKPNSKLKLGPEIGYYSLHDINSYPCEMGDDDKVQAASLCIDNAHGQSIWNVHLQPWKNEEEFWRLYETQYSILLDKARCFLERHAKRIRAENKVQAKAALFISAGFDASEWEGSGMQRHKVNVPTEFYARFTKDVVRIANEPLTACEGRVVSVLEGGYSDRAICSGILSHLSGLCPDFHPGDPSTGDSVTLDDMMRGLQINSSPSQNGLEYDRVWWSEANLSALEAVVNPAPPTQTKKIRSGQRPTYATPTESFAYKIIDPNKFARSVSGTLREKQPTRPATPPPPAVDWIVAAQELSNILIPADRQTRSHTADELAVPRDKKEKSEPAKVPTAGSVPQGRQLRDRSKAKLAGQDPDGANGKSTDDVKKPNRSSNRRQTMHEIPSSSDDPPALRVRRASQRFSAVTDISSDVRQVKSSPPPSAHDLPVKTTLDRMHPPPAPNPSKLQVPKARAAPQPHKSNGIASASAPVSPAKSALVSPQLQTANDIDQLTSGLKKIVLKVGTREEHDRKQKEREAAERRARAIKGAETRRLNAAAKKTIKPVIGPSTKQNTVLTGNVPSADVITTPNDPFESGRGLPSSSPSESAAIQISDVASRVPMNEAVSQIPQGSAAPVNTAFSMAYDAGSGKGESAELNQIDRPLTPHSFTSDKVPATKLPRFAQHAAVSSTPNGALPQWSSSGIIPFAPTSGHHKVQPSGNPQFGYTRIVQPTGATADPQLPGGTKPLLVPSQDISLQSTSATEGRVVPQSLLPAEQP